MMFLNTQVFGSKFIQVKAGFSGRFKLLHFTLSMKHQLMGVKHELFKTPVVKSGLRQPLSQSHGLEETGQPQKCWCWGPTFCVSWV